MAETIETQAPEPPEWVNTEAGRWKWASDLAWRCEAAKLVDGTRGVTLWRRRLLRDAQSQYERETGMFYSNERPECMSDDTANWLESLRDITGLTMGTIIAIIERAEFECYDTDATVIARTRYAYLRFAGANESTASIFQWGM